MYPARMNLIRIKSTKIGLILLTMLAVSCSLPTVNTDQYHGVKTTENASNGPVTELHRLAISASNQQQYDQSVSYLQRAIKIEPRNARSWYYLAQSYWYKKSYRQCLDMIERSYSYSSVEDGLDNANDELKTLCMVG